MVDLYLLKNIPSGKTKYKKDLFILYKDFQEKETKKT